MLRKSLLLIAALVCGNASAGTETWNLGNANFGGSGNSNYLNMVVDGIGLTITGWTDASNQGGDLTQSQLYRWSGGVGIENLSNPEHAVDNSNGYDALLLSFDTAVSLDGVSVGWYSGDADMSFAAYTGSGNVNSLANLSWNEFLSNGWISQGDYTGSAGTAYRSVSNTVTSKYWIVGAFNPAFGGSSSYTGAADYMKINGLYTTSPDTPDPGTGIPEPSAILLFALGLLLLRRSGKHC
ncbi:exosortase-dependent surface protein XDP1 [Bowmanella denitrificans]|uniref:exosortase-dependent surface protein XDP1 n=1 Tax=Bowmanella denitrificans TaxID=366582 RepID=UPI000C99DC53|nr:exosortase-dependent surface protein XDP1 [Bowmanella denitrificans]